MTSILRSTISAVTLMNVGIGMKSESQGSLLKNESVLKLKAFEDV